jgi:hypothetical protein
MGAEAVAAAVAERFPQAGTSAQPGTGPEPAGAEFVIFSKPELGRLSSADLAAVWDLFAASFAAYDVTVHRIKITTGPELDQAGVMQRHYGVINQISRLGRPALTEAAEKALGELLAEVPEDAVVLGGHQLLERYAEVSPFALAMLFSNAKVSRLGPGTYAAPIRMDGMTVVILNGFHPRQLSFFTAADAVCAFLHGSSPTDWEVLRSELVGATDPSQANARSLRGTLYADPTSFGLTSVNSNFNGVHMSAGPLEGLGELDRFFGEVQPLTDWSFARTLAAAGASSDTISALLENPVIEADGGRGTAFDLTEGVNPEPAAKLLVGARRLS